MKKVTVEETTITTSFMRIVTPRDSGLFSLCTGTPCSAPSGGIISSKVVVGGEEGGDGELMCRSNSREEE